MNKNRKIIWLFLILISVVLTLVIGALIYLNFLTSKITDDSSQYFSNNIKKVIVEDLKKEYPDSIKRQVDIVQDLNKSEKERYQALVALSFYFESEYTQTRNPKVREYNEKIIKSYAQKNFKKMFKNGDFTILCSDPECGQQLDKEIVEILNIIAKSDLPSEVKVPVRDNLTTAGLAPDKDIINKQFGFKLVFSQLNESSNNEASRAANLLKAYAKVKYKMDL